MLNEVTQARMKAGLSQNEFAIALQISPRTLQQWEQGRRKPSGSARALLNIAAKHPKIIRESFKDHQHKQKMSIHLLDNMATLLLSGEEIAFSDLILDWVREGLECETVKRPTDKDPLRLAVKASIIERLTEVLNTPPHNEDQKPPKWSNSIGQAPEPTKLQSDRLLEGEEYCPAFAKRNLFVVSNFMFFI